MPAAYDLYTTRLHRARFAARPVLSTRFRPDTRLDRGGHYVGSHGGCDGRQRRPRPERALRRAGRSPGGRPGGALERAAARGGAREGGGEVRGTARRKQEVVLRLLRGESLDALARETGQAAGT